MWLRLMLLAFVLNGLCNFGLRILTEMGLAKDHTLHYLVFWYLAGAVAVFLSALRSPASLGKTDLLIGGGLGILSASGQACMGMALASGLPGNVVFPVALAGGLFIVVAAGVTVFRERVGPAGTAGILLGIASIALLSIE